ncbi:MAG TPA: hypothetical protein PK990_07125, partial [Salinivirgaceae bacterium]|nr:hypothetical protein [Salinivirgaceae bacterium]
FSNLRTNSLYTLFGTVSFSEKKNDSFHVGLGTGLRIAMNENFIIAFDYGKAWLKQDGSSGIYIGLNYAF